MSCPDPLHVSRDDVRTEHGQMSFADSFGGYFVIHSALLNPERRDKFSADLTRVGIDTFELISPMPVEETDSRLAAYGTEGSRLVSLIDCFERAIEIAEGRSLKSVAIFEDDITFRQNFKQLWGQVESKVHSTEWDILVLHRSTTAAGGPVIESRHEKTKLVKIKHNTLMHCVILRAPAYPKFKRALHYCIRMGYPADFFYGVFTHEDSGTIVATTKNLSGQTGGLVSGLQRVHVRKRFFHSEFECYRNRVEFAIVCFLRLLRRFARKVISN
jgi:hypothetical protein